MHLDGDEYDVYAEIGSCQELHGYDTTDGFTLFRTPCGSCPWGKKEKGKLLTELSEKFIVRNTFSYSVDTQEFLEDMYITSLRNGEKKTRSKLVAEAIKLLWDKRNEAR